MKTKNTRQGTFRINNNIRKPRHVFIWVLNAAKLNNQEQICLFLLFFIADNQIITDATLELSNGVFYPMERWNPTTEFLEKSYRTLVEYQKQFNSYISNPIIDFKLFKDLYGILLISLIKKRSSNLVQLN